MEDTLKTLLEAEMQAEELVAAADAEREQMIRAALDDARAAEEKFEARVPEIREAFNRKAEQRAQTSVGELERRFGEHQRNLGAQAEERKAEALEAALRILADPDRD